ncbi:MAG: hsdR [Herminiimonas sp.]|nr:hsdR [Herminiimonas sp.]
MATYGGCIGVEMRRSKTNSGIGVNTTQTAWRNKTNHDIAASIIGHMRQAALGEALLPFEQRVANAMRRIYASHSWTQVQRRRLDRLAKQLTHE